jgi:hypothetical protein
VKAGELPRRAWRLIRHDIGRKLTALVFALALWSTLEGWVTKDDHPTLPVRTVRTRDEADLQRASTPAIYLIVPDSLMVLSKSTESVTLHIKGPAEDVSRFNLSVVLSFDATQLGTENEKTFEQVLERDLFKARGGDNPHFADFRVSPPSLTVKLALKRDADLTLGSLNVATEGTPRDTYYFKESRILVRPNQVRLSGPSAAIAELRDRPELVRLAPVRIEGRSASVVQLVGLSQELLDRGVTLQTPDHQVEVTIFLEPEDISVDLLSVPVHYENEDALRKNKQSARSATPSLDLRVTGPRAEIGGALSKEELAKRIHLVFDWRDANAKLEQARPPVHVYLEGLSDAVKVRLLAEDADPFIEYSLDQLKDPP